MISEDPVVILAGGLGTRLSEETDRRPKPMVMIGQHPILWHVMSIYATQGFKNFVIATGYKHELIEEWVEMHNKRKSWGFDCRVQSIFTGSDTETSGRIRKIIKSCDSPRFLLTYGDGLANVRLPELVEFHNQHKKIATVTAVRPPARFGYIQSSDGLVTRFGEKNQADAGWINGGFFVLDRGVLSYLTDDNIPFEKNPMNSLVSNQQLMALEHHGYWQPMDTLREKLVLTEHAKSQVPPWLAQLP